jgi:pilus assembly protein Flp/PilA
MAGVVCRFLKDDSGATVIEYALLASLICVVIVSAVSGLGGQVAGLFNRVADEYAKVQ